MLTDIETKKYTVLDAPEEALELELEESEMDEGPEEKPEASLEETRRPHDPILAYLREIGSVPLLSREREVELGKQMQICRKQIFEALFSTPWRSATS